jgi:hypothetical protein
MVTNCNPAAQKALKKNSRCRQNVNACRGMIDSDYTITDNAGICDTIGVSSMTGLPYLENTDYPTWTSWTSGVCVADTGRTAAPTAAPVVIAKVSRNTTFSTSEQSSICSAMQQAAVADEVINFPGALKCVQTEEQVTARRRLLNVTTTTLYSIDGSISAAQAKVAKEVLSEVGLDKFASNIASALFAVDPLLGASAVVSITPLNTNAPTKQPTKEPTPAPPTTAPAPTADVGEFSTSNRVAPTLIAAASFLLVLL